MLRLTILTISFITGAIALANYSENYLKTPHIDANRTITQITPTQKYTGIVGTVDNIAEQITVKIKTPQLESHGSGVIIARDNNTYYVVTAGHVVDPNNEYQIVTSDGATYALNNRTIKESSAYDLAIFSFTSEKDYTVATIGNYNVGANRNQVAFVSGFPNLKDTLAMRKLTGGKILEQGEADFNTKDSYSLQDNGRGLLYSNLSYKGMSGGAVLDREGSLVGINTGAENELYIDAQSSYNEIALGYGLGISIPDILSFIATETELETAWLQITDNSPAEVNEEESASIEAQLLSVERPNNDADIVTWMNYGNRLWRYEKYDRAIDAFNRVIAIAPDFHQAYYGIALVYWNQKNWIQVVNALDKATQINPNLYYYWRYLGLAYDKLDRIDEAIAAHETAITKNPQDFVLHTEYGYFLEETKQYDRAIASYNKALELNPYHSWIYNNRGVVYYDLAQYERAIADFDSAIEFNPYNIEAYSNRGAAYDDLQQYERAIVDYSKAILLDPNYAGAYGNRGLTYYNLGQSDRALADYQQAISLDSQQTEAYLNRGIIYAESGQDDLALADWTKAISLDPQSTKAYRNRGRIYRKLQQYDIAIADWTKAISLDPQSADNYTNRGSLYNTLMQYEAAEADFTQAITLNPQLADAYLERAYVYLALQNVSLYQKDLEQAAILLEQQGQISESQRIKELLSSF